MQFLREYKLEIGSTSGAKRVLVTISGLDISFNITKSTNSKQNAATITIYNLKKATRDLIEKNAEVVLSVRYDKDPFVTLFSGEVLTFTSKNLGVDIETKMILGSGVVAMKQGDVERSFAAGTSISVILSTILTDDMKLPKPIFGGQYTQRAGVGLNATLPKTRLFSGHAIDILDSLCSTHGLEWSIRDGVPLVSPYSASTGEIVVLSPSTGLLGSPERIAVNPNNTEDTANTANPEPASSEPKGKGFRTPDGGYKVQALLNPRINVGDSLEIVSRHVNGIYKVTKVVHTGTFEGEDWTTKAEVVIADVPPRKALDGTVQSDNTKRGDSSNSYGVLRPTR